ncbi:MAG: tetratricopeptide repeat protein, partial [Thermoguttaceae bacterium]
LRGLIYQNLPATKKALDEYEKALSLDPYLVSALLRRAETRSNAGDYARALNDCNTAISIDIARPEGYSARGMVYAKKAEFPKAIEDFTQAVSLDRKCAKAYSGRAAVYYALGSGEFDTAAKSNDRAEKASCLAKAKEFEQKCIDDATEAIGANRHMARAYLTRGLAYYAQELWEKAVADFSAAIREDPKMASAYYNRGALLAKQPNLRFLDAAIKDFEEASKLQPENAMFYLRIGQCYEQKGDAILATAYLKKWREKTKEQENRNVPEDFRVKHRSAPDLQPDIDLEPLEKAKKDLEQKLDATAEPSHP